VERCFLLAVNGKFFSLDIIPLSRNRRKKIIGEKSQQPPPTTPPPYLTRVKLESF